MKISMIVPVYKESKHLNKFLEEIKDQSSKRYELIFVIDTNAEDTMGVVEKHRAKLDSKIKIIYNSKRTSRSEAIFMGANVATGKYSLVVSLGNTFSDSLIADLANTAKEKDTDIIEFKAKMVSPIKHEGKIRKAFNKPVVLEETHEAFAFSYPFDFNKLYKTDVLKQASKYKLNVKVNSRFSIDINYLALIFAETYSTVNKSFVTSKSKLNQNYNPLRIIRQYEALNKLLQDHSSQLFSDRIIYSQYFSEAVYMSSMAKATRNKILIKKFNEKFKKQKSTIFADIFETNKFALIVNNETKLLRDHQTITSLTKLHKELG